MAVNDEYTNEGVIPEGINLSALDKITPQQSSGPQLTTDYINSFMPQGLSPEEQAVYTDQSQQSPVTGPLAASSYYPDINNQVNVGGYSGSEVGSLSLFAPGGGLVPLAMMDARDLAIQKAAMQKAQELDAFRKRYQAPTTKHTTVQPELEKTYYEGLNKWRQNALKKAGGNPTLANKILETDQGFNAWNQSAQTAAKIEDSVVQKFADIDAAVKTGKFVMTPELKRQKDEFMSAYHGLGQSPFNQKGHSLNQEWLKLNAEHDFANVANEYILHALKQQDASAGVDTSNPDYIKTVEATKEYFKPETLKSMAESMQQTHFPDMQVPDIEKRLKGMFGAMKEKRDVTVSQKRETADGAGYKYDANNDFSDEPTSINTTVQQVSVGGKPGGLRQSNLDATDGLTFKKPIKAIIPVGKRVYFTDNGLIATQEIGNKTAELGKMVIVDVNDDPGTAGYGTPVTEDQKGKVKTKKESMILGKYLEGTGEEKTERPFFIPTKDVENVLVKKWKDGKVETGVPVDEHYSRVEKYNNANQENKNTNKPKTVKQNGYTYTLNEKTGQYE